MAPSALSDHAPHIVDIRRSEIDFSIRDDIKSKLNPIAGGEKQLPAIIFYDQKGLKLFEDITYLEEYYLTNSEIEVLERYSDSIAERIPHDSQLIELGSGYVSLFVKFTACQMLYEVNPSANNCLETFAKSIYYYRH